MQDVMKEISKESDTREPKLTTNDAGTMTVVRAKAMSIFPEFYNRAKFHWPVTLASRIGHIGSTSMTSIQELRDNQDNISLARDERKLVILDKKLRKPVEIPSRQSEMMKLLESEEKPLLINLPLPSGDVFKHNVYVRPSDTDMLHHVNQATWLQYCMDSAATGATKGYFQNFKIDPLALPVLKVQVVYSQEGFPGDVLSVSCWEDKERDDSLFFEITNTGAGKTCVSCCIKFGKEVL